MCRLLGIPRSSYYYKAADLVAESELEASVEKIFLENQKRYGARKIKQKLEQEGVTVSRRRIRRVMKRLNLVSLSIKKLLLNLIPREKMRHQSPTTSTVSLMPRIP